MTEIIEFNGIKYRRYLNKKGTLNRYYRCSTQHYMKTGERYLHRAIWAFHNGDIKAGSHIHHKDGNHLNNDISNLECLSSADHFFEHREERSKRASSENQIALLEAIRPLAAKWHRTDDGKAWHKQHAKNVFSNRQKVEVVCINCDDKYLADSFLFKAGKTKYCSNRCKSAYRRKLYPEEAKKYQKIKTLNLDMKN
jgi:hypothetical protein